MGTLALSDGAYLSPVVANGVLYITNRRQLFAIAEGASSKMDETN